MQILGAAQNYSVTGVKMEPCEIKVTYINKKWHVRLFVEGEVYSEQACAERSDIGISARDQLRWYDKLGGISKFAAAARKRMNKEVRMPIGKIEQIRNTIVK